MSERLPAFAVVGVATAAFLVGSVVEATPTYDSPTSIEASFEGHTSNEIYVGEMSLPDNIGRVATSTVEIGGAKETVDYTDTYGRHVGDVTYVFTGSGTVVNYRGTKVVITAGHVAAGASSHCRDEEVRLPADGQAPFPLKVKLQTPAAPTDGAYRPAYNNGRDASVIVPDADGRFSEFTAMTVQDHVHLGRGDSIYSLGYGPRTDHDPNPMSKNQGDQSPMVVPGTVLKTEGNKVLFLTNINPTADIHDYNGVHHGDSGGTMVDAEGEYIGDVIAVAGEGNPFTGKDIEKNYGVILPTTDEKRNFGVAIGQIIDTSDLDQMVSHMEPCTSGVPKIHKNVLPGTNIHALPAPTN